MSQASPHEIETVLRTYFRAKDENRPHLLRSVFTPAATLQVNNKASTIAFPPVAHGLDTIADVLVRQFGQTYENVYSFCMSRPRTASAHFSCDWLVGMSEKEGKNVRVGCGRYDWQFRTQYPHLADGLVITIEAMGVLSPDHLDSVLGWLTLLSYPWCATQEFLDTAPEIADLDPILRYVGRDRQGIPPRRAG
ncbi:MAG: nuclear transport factor 2 family protein [Deltaproteobacteria bacterium]|nr:nuclear transport factor 2 family protein [Deltaproteobacteria bacterium]